jgi:hypothetical protein
MRINGDYNAFNFAIIVFAIAGDIARRDFTIALFYAQKTPCDNIIVRRFFSNKQSQSS